MGVSKHTIYAWKARYGGMDEGEAPGVRQLRDENARLKRLVADPSLDKFRCNSVVDHRAWCGGEHLGGEEEMQQTEDQPVSTSGDPQPARAIQLAGKFYC